MYYMDTTPYSGLFMLAAVMEIPTFHLKISTLYPSTRNDTLFLTTFFLTRLLFHAYMITSFVLPPPTKPIFSHLGIGAGKTLMHSPVPAC
ncbi:hypothetical protein QFC20_007334 [Naganishia adeliensis]|uniref:Uncharacterized protein n=1 Tax=Naganishia adeliensis TaxID=92952 RepID=A0ACC2V0Z8_9TREE|nr:hypothetical protein QFC20_007334 [Naganishia adeliensis]